MDVKIYKKLLIDKLQKLTNDEDNSQTASDIVELDQSKVGRLSRMDALQTQAMSLETQRRRELELTKIRAALARIEKDNYTDIAYVAMKQYQKNVWL